MVRSDHHSVTSTQEFLVLSGTKRTHPPYGGKGFNVQTLLNTEYFCGRSKELFVSYYVFAQIFDRVHGIFTFFTKSVLERR